MKVNRVDVTGQDSKVGPNAAGDGIDGLIIAEEGEFKSGRGRFDRASLQKIVELGNAAPRGVRKRAQHPNQCDDGLGSNVAWETNYRLDTRADNGNAIVRADLKFTEAGMKMNPKGMTPWGPYLLSEIKDNPGSFQNSIVLDYQAPKGELAEGEVPLWIPTKLKASDFVANGDATHGDSLSEEDMIGWLQEGSARRASGRIVQVLSTQLDRAFEDKSREFISARLGMFVTKYLDNRFGPEPDQPKLENEMELSEVQATLSKQSEAIETLTTQLGEVASTLKSTTEESQAALAAKTRSEEIAAICQQAGSTKAAEFIADEKLSANDVRGLLFKQLCDKGLKLEGTSAPEKKSKELSAIEAEWEENTAMLSQLYESREQFIEWACKDAGIDVPKKD